MNFLLVAANFCSRLAEWDKFAFSAKVVSEINEAYRIAMRRLSFPRFSNIETEKEKETHKKR